MKFFVIILFSICFTVAHNSLLQGYQGNSSNLTTEAPSENRGRERVYSFDRLNRRGENLARWGRQEDVIIGIVCLSSMQTNQNINRLKTKPVHYAESSHIKFSLFDGAVLETQKFGYKKLSTATKIQSKNTFEITKFALIFIITWQLVPFWERFLCNFFYRTLKLDKNSTLQSLGIAVSLTVILIAFMYLSSLNRNSENGEFSDEDSNDSPDESDLGTRVNSNSGILNDEY